MVRNSCVEFRQRSLRQLAKSEVAGRRSARMSDKRATVSEVEQEQQESDSVFDFLYYDARRVGSYLSQFDNFGLLQTIKHVEGTTEARSSSFSGSAGLNVPLVVKGQTGADHRISEEARENAEKSYDPFWINATNLIDLLNRRSMIKRDLATAAFGQFVLATGGLTIVDLTVLRAIMASSILRQATGPTTEKSAGNRRNRQSNAAKTEPTQWDQITELIGLLPHAVQARFACDPAQVWASLREDSLVTTSTDLLLKYGSDDIGSWNVLGILDARPDKFEMQNQVVGDVMIEGLAPAQKVIGPIARLLLGRPSGSYGITPLLIFRSVGLE